MSLEYYHQSSTLSLSGSVHDISSEFTADTGYLTRTGLTSAVFALSPFFYPKGAWLRRISPSIGLSVLKDHDSGLYENEKSVGLTAVLKGNSTVSILLADATEIFLGRRFQTDGLNLVGRSQITKYLSLRLSFRVGKAIRYAADPFQGHGIRAAASTVFQPSENLNLSLSWTYASLFRSSTEEKIYNYHIYWSRLTYQVNKYFFFRGIVEYNAYRGELLTDFLASFTYIPGTVIHLGYGSLYEKSMWEVGVVRPS